MTKEGKFARFLVERLQISKENKAIYDVICHNFLKIMIEGDDKKPYIVAVKDNREQLFRIHSRESDGEHLMAVQLQEKTSTLKPYRLSITGNNIRFATLEDLIRHKVI